MNSVSLDGIKTLEDKLDDEQEVVLDELMKQLNKALPSSIHCRTTSRCYNYLELIAVAPVYSCIPVYTHVYLCILMYTGV